MSKFTDLDRAVAKARGCARTAYLTTDTGAMRKVCNHYKYVRNQMTGGQTAEDRRVGKQAVERMESAYRDIIDVLRGAV